MPAGAIGYKIAKLIRALYVGQVLAENRPMLRLMAKLNFRVEETADPLVVQVVLEL